MKLLLPLIGLSLGVLQIEAAVIPYTNDFSGSGSNSAFPSENLDANWNLSGGSYQFTYTSTTVTASTASIPLTNVAGTSFTLESQFTVNSFGNVNNNGETIGFGLFGANATFTGADALTAYYLVDFKIADPTNAGTGLLRILALGDTSGFSATNGVADDNATTSLAVTLGTTYTFKLTGTYSGSTLSMTFSLWNSNGTSQIGTTATATDTSPLTGTNFGYRNRVGISGGTFSTAFDNFNLAPVPEAHTTGLIFLAAIALLPGIRRRLRRTEHPHSLLQPLEN